VYRGTPISTARAASASANRQRQLGVAIRQRQPALEQPQLELQPPAENEVTTQVRLRPREPPGCRLQIARSEPLLGQVLQGGDRDLHAAVPARHLERFLVPLDPLVHRPDIAQHPTGEVHPAPGKAWHLPPFDLVGVAGEAVQGSDRTASKGLRVPGEQQRVQGCRRVLDSGV